jgi:hypothetical protein
MNKEVKGCADCPFLYKADPRHFTCTHPDAPRLVIDAKNGIPITPGWCPLKKEPITISIKQ